MQENINSDILTIEYPDHPIPLVIDSPHSGQILPQDFSFDCALSDLKKIEDSYVDELFRDACHHGATYICAQFPRSYIDVNRKINDIDPILMNEPWPEALYGLIAPTNRSHAGIGLIPRLIKAHIPIYSKSTISAKDINHRITNYYRPYHHALSQSIETAHKNHGFSLHLNCHSMPHSSAYPKHAQSVPAQASDIVLGTHDGYSASKEITDMLLDYWQGLGYRVSINDPFKGVELIQAYASPTQGKHSIQIEVNRSLYMNEETREKTPNFAHVQKECSNMIQLCADYIRETIMPIAAD